MMNRSTNVAPRRVALPPFAPVRLDRLDHPYGPSIAVFEAFSNAQDVDGGRQTASGRLRRELARLVGVPEAWLLPGNGIDELLDALFLWRRDGGPLVLFPPTHPDDFRRAVMHRVPVITLQRTARFMVDLDVETAADLPTGCWAIVQTPNDPTSTLLEPLDAVRLARACDVLVIDERYGAYSGRSLLPLVREFDNIVLLQTLETWAGLNSFPVAYAVAPPALLAQINGFRAKGDIAAGGAIAALATLGDLPHVQATVRRVRQERSRLYRMLRKLNMVSPCPGWGNFLPVRVERGDPPRLVAGLAERGVRVHKPSQPELARLLRVSVGLPEHTDALKNALIDVGLEL